MKKIVEKITLLPKWYGIIIILIYAVLMAELVSLINEICISYEIQIEGIIKTFMQINYVVMVMSCIIIWVILSLLYHLTALLFNGKADFGKFLFTASYPFIMPSLVIVVALLLLDNVKVGKYVNMLQFIEQDSSYKIAMSILNYSFIPYYLLIVGIVRYLYKLKWLYAWLSMLIPVVSIYIITKLFKFILEG